MTVLIVGAGLAGLTCARHLHQQQIPVTVLEASDDVGGRVRSDHIEGFTRSIPARSSVAKASGAC
jgi:phytoene dehydrogenase-like protein